MSVQTPAAEGMQPATFAGLFGWLHNAQSASLDTGVVIVSPIGRDERCVHAPMRILADQLAAHGFPTLRYDHRGEGDSLPLPDADDTDAVQTWLEDIERAIDHLRRMTHVRRVVLAGVRLGATLAYAQATQADGLILLAPVLSGRSWLRQQQFSMQAGREAPQTSAMALDIDGVLLNKATADSLSRMNLKDLALPGAPVLMATHNLLSERFAASLVDGGVDATVSDFAGLEALFLDTHSNQVPQSLFDRVCDWMADRFGAETRQPRPDDTPSTGLAQPEPLLACDDYFERPIAFGSSLQGILTVPHHGADRARGVIFCNTGGEPRAGIGGFATTASRRLASQGITCLRFDFAGLGDSPAPTPHLRTHVYETPRRDDLAAAVALLKSAGSQEIFLVGVCSGAYHVLLEAENERVCGIFAVSPARLTWRKGDALTFGRTDQGRATLAYRSAALSPSAWRRLLQGRIDVYAVLRTLISRGLRRWRVARQASVSRSPSSILQAFLARGGRAAFLVGLDDSSLDEVNAHFGTHGARMRHAANLMIRVEPTLDHGLARSSSRELALSALMDWLNC